jgi:hypothetical protein
LGAAFSEAARNDHLGTVREVIVEELRKGGFIGLSDTFVKTMIPTGDVSPGSLVQVRFEDSRRGALFGTIAR